MRLATALILSYLAGVFTPLIDPKTLGNLALPKQLEDIDPLFVIMTVAFIGAIKLIHMKHARRGTRRAK